LEREKRRKGKAGEVNVSKVGKVQFLIEMGNGIWNVWRLYVKDRGGRASRKRGWEVGSQSAIFFLLYKQFPFSFLPGLVIYRFLVSLSSLAIQLSLFRFFFLLYVLLDLSCFLY